MIEFLVRYSKTWYCFESFIETDKTIPCLSLNLSACPEIVCYMLIRLPETFLLQFAKSFLWASTVYEQAHKAEFAKKIFEKSMKTLLIKSFSLCSWNLSVFRQLDQSWAYKEDQKVCKTLDALWKFTGRMCIKCLKVIGATIKHFHQEMS